MSTTVLISAGQGFAIPATLKPTTSAPRHRPFRPLGCSYSVLCELATLGDTYLLPSATYCCS